MRNWIVSSAFLALVSLAGAAQAQYYGDDQYRDDRYGQGQAVVRCESIDGRYRECPADTRGGVRLTRQISKTACVEGRSWGTTRGSVWVNGGCRGEFTASYNNGGNYGGGNYGGGYGNDIIRCDSNNNRWTHCPADTRRGVELVRQVSRNACVRDRSWGWDERGIWVSGGCRAEFQVRNRGGGQGQGQGQILRCESTDGRSRYCPVNTRGGVRMTRQLSRSPCVEGQSWGYDRNGIRVDRGCRAEFEVGYRGNQGWGWGRDN